MESVRLKVKETAHKPYILVNKVNLLWVWVNNSDTTIHLYWMESKCTVDGVSQVSHF